MISVQQLSRVFTTDDVETSALNQINLQVSKGDFIAIMGPSGCGKSTLLNILGLLDKPSTGDYFFQDKRLRFAQQGQVERIRRQHFGYIFQSFNLIDSLTVAENVELPLIYQGVAASERAKRVKQVLAKTSMDHRASHFPKQLSGGQQQRVAVARALVIEPAVIFADEPTGNLDTRNGHDVMNLLAELNEQGSTIVMVTHSESHATYGSRVIELLDGEIVKETRQQPMMELARA